MTESASAATGLRGLVLTGGFSRRMGRDKGLLNYAGRPAVARAFDLLVRVCGRAAVSLRSDQAAAGGYRGFPQIIDATGFSAPAAGLLSAWQAEPAAAWLVLATDMPLVDEALLRALLAARAPDRLATAFVNADGITEPLCAIWEPAAGPLLAGRVAEGRLSLREALEVHGAQLLPCPWPEKLRSIDTLEAVADVVPPGDD